MPNSPGWNPHTPVKVYWRKSCGPCKQESVPPCKLQARVLSGLESHRREQRIVTVVCRLWEMKQADLKLGCAHE